MNKKISLGAAVTFALIVAAAVFSITMVASRWITNQSLVALQEREIEYAKLSEIDREVRQRYYGEINEKVLQDNISAGFLQGLGDNQAQYYTAEEYASIVKKETQADASLGLVTKISADGYIEIVEVYPESPADIAGIKVGSTIVEINEEPVTTGNSEQKAALLKGPEGTQITIKERLDGEENFHDLVLRVVIPPTIYWEMLEGTSIAYLRITDFQDATANQFSRALKEIQEKNGSAIIFDLRSNENYELEKAYRILDRLVPAGPLVYAKYKDDTVQELETSDSNQITWPMAVIVNSSTSGTAEIFAQVLKDYGKASIIGSQTAGRGVRQETIRLSDGSAIKLTVAKYETPKGVVIDGEGIKPDFEITIPNVEENQWESVPREGDTQLSKAIETVSTK